VPKKKIAEQIDFEDEELKDLSEDSDDPEDEELEDLAEDDGKVVTSDDGETWTEHASIPSVPDKADLLSEGYSEEETSVIISHMTAIHDEIAELRKPRNFVVKPALRVSGKQTKGFWVCGRKLMPGSPWEVPIDLLDESQLGEIKTVEKGGHVAVEEIELEVEVEQ
jgi:hypothetical protein